MKVKAIEYILDGYPCFVTFVFKDIHQTLHRVTDKLPIVDLPYSEDPKNLPFTFQAPSQIINKSFNQNGQCIYRIRFLYDIISDDGIVEFEMFEEEYD